MLLPRPVYFTDHAGWFGFRHCGMSTCLPLPGRLKDRTQRFVKCRCLVHLSLETVVKKQSSFLSWGCQCIEKKKPFSERGSKCLCFKTSIREPSPGWRGLVHPAAEEPALTSGVLGPAFRRREEAQTCLSTRNRFPENLSAPPSALPVL